MLWLIQGPGSVMYDQWIVLQWQEVIFFSKASRLGLGTTQPLIHRILKASFIGGKMTMAWRWPLTDCHVVLRIRMCGAVSPVPMFLAPVQRDSCTFYFYCSHAHLSLFVKWLGTIGERTVIIIELTSCELCLYHSAGAVSCDGAAVCNLLLALPESWKLWLWRAWKIMLNFTWWIHVSITTAGTFQLPSL